MTITGGGGCWREKFKSLKWAGQCLDCRGSFIRICQKHAVPHKIRACCNGSVWLRYGEPACAAAQGTLSICNDERLFVLAH